MHYAYRGMKLFWVAICFFVATQVARAQIQVELKFKRLQYVAYEPVTAMLTITNLAGRDVDLHDVGTQRWFGFEVTGGEQQLLAPASLQSEPPLHIESGKTVSRKIDIATAYPVHDFGTYHVRANVFFADLNKFFYSEAKVFQVTNARPIWQKTVGVPDGQPGAGGTRTYSLLSNRFPDHTSLYVRVEDRNNSMVYSTYSLGRVISFEEPQVEIDRANQLHVLHCAAPRTWAYSHVGLNGELLKQSTFLQVKSQPHLRRASDGLVAVHGGVIDEPIANKAQNAAPKLSARPPNIPQED
ncbi:MAG: hypothetical protein ACJ8JD_00475 [Chthoniobacterales bacterium]